MRELLLSLLPLLLAAMTQAATPATTIADLPPEFTQCAAENATCTITGPMQVTFGAAGGFATPIVKSSSVACNWALVGFDPKPGVVKACYIAPIAAAPPPVPPVEPPAVTTINALSTVFTFCAVDGGTCPISAPMLVVFGAPGGYTMPIAAGQDLVCETASFGVDPNPGGTKACYASPTNQPDGTVIDLNPPAPPTPINTHGFYAYTLLPGLEAPGAIYSTFTPQPLGCIDTAQMRSWSDPVTSDAFVQGWCQKLGYIQVWSRWRNVHPFGTNPFPTVWPSEGEVAPPDPAASAQAAASAPAP